MHRLRVTERESNGRLQGDRTWDNQAGAG
jgi:hypothetical protein